MTRKERINRNIGLTFDFIRQVIATPKLASEVPNGTELKFIEKDFVTPEKKVSRKSHSTTYFRVGSSLKKVTATKSRKS